MKHQPTGPEGSQERIRRRSAWTVVILGLLTLGIILMFSPFRGPDELLNVSYDATRELFREIDASYMAKHPEVRVRTVHAGSVQQSLNVIKGLRADVVTLATAADVDAIVNRGMIDDGWRNRFPHHGSPFTSTIVFLVRAGNPKEVRDWPDIVRPDVKILAPSPKVSGAGRWAYLAAWSFAFQQAPNDEPHAAEFVTALYEKNPVLDQGSRGAMFAFLIEERGDVLLTWESEAWRVLNSREGDRIEIVYPSVSIVAEPMVAVMDHYTSKRGSMEHATGYLNYLFSKEAQEIAARHYLRPRDPEVAAREQQDFPAIKLITLEEVFGSWKAAEQNHFAAGGTFDRIYRSERKKRHGY